MQNLQRSVDRDGCSETDLLSSQPAAIYSAHLKLHPLLVLSVLVIAEHSLGVWGLLMAGEPSQSTRVVRT